MSLKDRYETIKLNLLKAEHQSGRQSLIPSNVKLIAVSKTFSVASIREVHGMGQNDFAENYVTEFVHKFDTLKDLKINWHFIGHLQTNKVEKVVGRADLIHSVDSEKLLKKIIQESEKKNLCQKILLQIKFGDEATKFGFEMSQIESILEGYKNHKTILFCGLMCILPLGLTDADKLKCFEQLVEKFISVKKNQKLSEDFKEVSMGMSDDFKLAIQAGSTMIRIGSAIFGVRS